MSDARPFKSLEFAFQLPESQYTIFSRLKRLFAMQNVVENISSIYSGGRLSFGFTWGQTRTQSLFMCFWGERRLGLHTFPWDPTLLNLNPNLLSPQKHSDYVRSSFKKFLTHWTLQTLRKVFSFSRLLSMACVTCSGTSSQLFFIDFSLIEHELQ